jgi:hypothetical protein
MGSVSCAYRKAVADVSALRRFFRACDWVRGKSMWTLTHLAKLPLWWAVDMLRTTRAWAHVRARAHDASSVDLQHPRYPVICSSGHNRRAGHCKQDPAEFIHESAFMTRVIAGCLEFHLGQVRRSSGAINAVATLRHQPSSPNSQAFRKRSGPAGTFVPRVGRQGSRKRLGIGFRPERVVKFANPSPQRVVFAPYQSIAGTPLDRFWGLAG